jgi:hypothetical protein
MTAKNRADIQADIDTILADNSTGDISEEDIRGVMETAKDSNLNLLETGNQTVAGTINEAVLALETIRMGWIDYADAATAGTPISITGGAGFVNLTNDGAGAGSNDLFKISSVGELWDVSANEFTWADGLKVGDVAEMRLNIIPTTTSANQIVNVKLQMGIGDPGEYPIAWESKYYKTSGVQQAIVVSHKVYMLDTITLDNPAKFQVESDGNCTIQVVGWPVFHLLRG